MAFNPFGLLDSELYELVSGEKSISCKFLVTKKTGIDQEQGCSTIASGMTVSCFVPARLFRIPGEHRGNRSGSNTHERQGERG
jgi:hypothetical protein